MTLGAGFSAAGFSPAGFGDIDTAAAPASDNLVDANGAQQTARAIDPATGQYILNADGRAQGMPRTRQLVLLRIKTVLNSSVVKDLGMRKQSEDRSAIVDRRIQANLADALADLVKLGMVEILSNDVTNDSPSRDRAILRWKDLTTGQEFTER